ncbi:MAG TPA: hypothetical protein IAC03_03240 [Candidatus Coprenecus pullistercoris]|nr:hypothetical protein [Candidatus Coprenecus pullistercoris]
MEKNNRVASFDYKDIRNLQDLRRCKRLLSSRIEHQEIMVMYKLRCAWDFVSPSNLIDMGCRAIASHNSSFNLIYRTVDFIRGFINIRKSR